MQVRHIAAWQLMQGIALSSGYSYFDVCLGYTNIGFNEALTMRSFDYKSNLAANIDLRTLNL